MWPLSLILDQEVLPVSLLLPWHKYSRSGCSHSTLWRPATLGFSSFREDKGESKYTLYWLCEIFIYASIEGEKRHKKVRFFIGLMWSNQIKIQICTLNTNGRCSLYSSFITPMAPKLLRIGQEGLGEVRLGQGGTYIPKTSHRLTGILTNTHSGGRGVLGDPKSILSYLGYFLAFREPLHCWPIYGKCTV